MGVFVRRFFVKIFCAFFEYLCSFDGQWAVQKYFFVGKVSVFDNDIEDIEELLSPFYRK